MSASAPCCVLPATPEPPFPLHIALRCAVQGNTCRRVGELTGHTASVTHLAIDERLNHVFSLSGDKVIKVGLRGICRGRAEREVGEGKAGGAGGGCKTSVYGAEIDEVQYGAAL